MELFEEIRREYEFGVGTIKGVARKLGVHRRMVREAVASALPPPRKKPARRRAKLAPPSQYRSISGRFPWAYFEFRSRGSRPSLYSSLYSKPSRNRNHRFWDAPMASRRLVPASVCEALGRDVPTLISRNQSPAPPRPARADPHPSAEQRGPGGC